MKRLHWLFLLLVFTVVVPLIWAHNEDMSGSPAAQSTSKHKKHKRHHHHKSAHKGHIDHDQYPQG